MCATPKLSSYCDMNRVKDSAPMHGDCPVLVFNFTGGKMLVCECPCHSMSLPCPRCGWKQRAGFTQCINCNAAFKTPVKVGSPAPPSAITL